MSKYFKFVLTLLFVFSVSVIPTASFAQEEETIKEDKAQERKEICEAAKVTSKDRGASEEDREEAKKVYKECKKEARKKKRAQCVPTGSRLARC